MSKPYIEEVLQPNASIKDKARVERAHRDAQRAPPSTRFQHAKVRGLMSRLELPTRQTTLMHRIPFRAAGLAEPPVDRPLEPLLQALSFAQASALIGALQRQLGIEDDDDEDD